MVKILDYAWSFLFVLRCNAEINLYANIYIYIDIGTLMVEQECLSCDSEFNADCDHHQLLLRISIIAK